MSEKNQYISHLKASGPNSDTKLVGKVKWIVAIATIGGFLFGYDTGVISGAIIFIEKELHISSTYIGIIVSALLFGAALGAALSGKISDLIGRKKTIIIIAVVFCLGTIGTSLASTFILMVIFRSILGIAVGSAAATVPIYIAEMAPANKRGMLVTIQELMIVTGQLFAYANNALINEIWGGEHAWRWMLGIATVPAIILWLAMAYAPESPRWLISRDRAKDAKQVLKKLRLPEDIDWEMQEMQESHDNSKKLIKKSIVQCFADPVIRKFMCLGIGIATIQQLTGVNAIMYYAPTILTETGMGTNAALLATIANGSISVVMTILGIWMIGKIGRRPITILGQVGCMLCMFFIFIILTFVPTTVHGEINIVRSLLVLLGMLLFLCFQQGALSPVTWLLLSEIFPMHMRGMIMGAAILFMWITNGIISFIFPILIVKAGLEIAILLFAVIGLGSSYFVIRCVPETKGRSLEEIEAYLSHKYAK